MTNEVTRTNQVLTNSIVDCVQDFTSVKLQNHSELGEMNIDRRFIYDETK